MTTLRFTCYGLPRPQGSTRAFVVKGRAVTTSDTADLKPWRASLADAGREAMADLGEQIWDGPVHVSATFTLPRPKSRPKRDRWPDRKPDIDKLARALLDGLTGPVVTDDAQVCVLTVGQFYVGDPLALLEPGVIVAVNRLGDKTPTAMDA